MTSTETETWTTDRCAAEWGVAASTWRDAVADGRAPRPLPGFDEQRRRRWDPDTVRDWARPGRGARTDLSAPVLTDDAREVAAMLAELVAVHGPTVPRERLREMWLDTYPEDGATAHLPAGTIRRRATRQGARGDGKAHTAGTYVRRRLGKALVALERAGAVTRVGGRVVRVVDDGLLGEISEGTP